MSTFPPATAPYKLYSLALSLVALVLEVYLLKHATIPEGTHLTLALALVCLLAVFGFLDVQIGPNANLSLDFSVIFASALLFSPAIAILITLLGSLPCILIRFSRPWSRALVNLSSITLTSGCTALVLGIYSSGATLRLTDPSRLAVVLTAAAVMFLVNATTMATAIMLLGRPWLAFWQDIGLSSLSFYCLEVALGLLSAILAQKLPWVLIFLVAPVYAVYAVVEQQTRLRRRLEEALAIAEAERTEAQKMAHQAYHDALTGLPNRALFSVYLGEALSNATTHDGTLAVLFVDLDGFKAVNDTSGHEAGDRLLQEVAERLKSCVRAEDIVARLGGDEFTLLLRGVDEAHAVRVAERVIDAVRGACDACGRQAVVGASIGITFSLDGRGNPDELLREADLGMYQAKATGKGRHVLYTAHDNLLAC